MAFKIRADLAQRQQLFACKTAGFRPRSMEDPRGVVLREDKDNAIAIMQMAGIDVLDLERVPLFNQDQKQQPPLKLRELKT